MPLRRSLGVSIAARSLVLGPAAFAVASAWFPDSSLASPLINLSLVGRIQGSSDPYSPTLAVSAGDLVEYQIIGNLSPVGTTFVAGSMRTITSLTVGPDGIQSMAFDIFQLSTDAIQIDASAPATLNPDPTPRAGDTWNGAVDASGGTPTIRSSTTNHDLTFIRPIHNPGFFSAIDPEVIVFGSFSVASVGSGASTLVRQRVSSSGSLHINGSPGMSFFLSSSDASTVDPKVRFIPLMLTLDAGSNPQWNVDASGNWSDSGNWLDGNVPNGAGTTAEFKSVITAPRTVAVDSPKTVGSMVFDNVSKYTVAGPAALSMNAGGSMSTSAVGGPPAIVNVAAGSHEIAAPMVLASDTLLTVGSAASTLTLSGPISGAGSLSMAGTGTVVLSASNSYSGSTIINGGTLRVSSSDNLGDGSPTNDIHITGATLRFDGPVSTSRNIVMGADDSTFDLPAGDVTLAGGITGPASSEPFKTGSGTLFLTGPSTYLGRTHIVGGTLRAGAAHVLSPASAYFVEAGSALDLNNFDQTVLGLDSLGSGGSITLGGATITVTGFNLAGFTGIISGTGGVTVHPPSTIGYFALGGVNTYSGPTTVIGNGSPDEVLRISASHNLGDGSPTNILSLSSGGTILIDGSFIESRNISLPAGMGGIELMNGHSVTFSGNVTGPGGIIIDSHSGTLALTGSSGYSGPTTVMSGTLGAGAANVFSPSSAFTITSTDGSNLHLNGFNQTIASLAGSGPVHLDAGRLTILGLTSTTYSGSIDGTGGLTKDGAGTLTLAGSSTYTGATIVAGGTLRLFDANRIANGSNMVLDGGTFDANGFSEDVGTLQLLDDSIIDLGPVSVLRYTNSGGVAWSAGAELLVDDWSGNIAGGGAERLLIGTSASLSAGQLSQVFFRNPAGFGPGLYAAKQLSSGEVVPLPEPSAAISLALLAAPLMARRRRTHSN